MCVVANMYIFLIDELASWAARTPDRRSHPAPHQQDQTVADVSQSLHWSRPHVVLLRTIEDK